MPSIITWNPIGTGFNWANTLIAAGASDYSDPPTPDEINARSGINQIYAEVNRRLELKQSVQRVNYLIGGGQTDLIKLFFLRDIIDEIRDFEELPVYNWSSSHLMTKEYLGEYREALDTDHYLLKGRVWPTLYSRTIVRSSSGDSENPAPYPPNTNDSIFNTTGRFGQSVFQFLGQNYETVRAWWGIDIPDYLKNTNKRAVFDFKYEAHPNITPFVAELRQTTAGAIAGDFSKYTNIGSIIDSFTISASGIKSIDAVFQMNDALQFVVGAGNEFNGIAPGAPTDTVFQESGEFLLPVPSSAILGPVKVYE